MIDPEQLTRQAEIALSAGNVLLPVRYAVDLLANAGPLDQRIALAFLHSVLRSQGATLWPAERDAIRALIENLRLPRKLAAEKRAMLVALDTGPAAPDVSPIGCANTLLAGSGWLWGRSFGACTPLAVTFRADGEGIGLSYSESGQTLLVGFYQGVRAALEQVVNLGLKSLDNAQFLGSLSFYGSFPSLHAAVDGDSIGLAAAVGALSSLLRISVPRTCAFTGRVDVTGEIHQVGGIREKLAAARDKGIERVFMPSRNGDVPREYHDLAIPVSSLQEVVAELFPKRRIAPAIGRLRRARLPDRRRRRPWITLDSGKEDGTKWLFTCVGARDPFGELRSTPDLPAPADGVVESDGPILAACRAVRPSKVFLFYTVHRPGNHFEDRAKEVKDILEHADPNCDADLIPLEGVSDPTDYAQLVPIMTRQVSNVLGASRIGSAMLFVNLSSGAPQMETTWHLLVERGVLPRAYRLQVREHRWVKNEERVRLADPSMGLP